MKNIAAAFGKNKTKKQGKNKVAPLTPAGSAGQRFRTLPIVPVSGGRLVAAAAAAVVREGAWPSAASAALQALGCHLLDASWLPDGALQVTHSPQHSTICIKPHIHLKCTQRIACFIM